MRGRTGRTIRDIKRNTWGIMEDTDMAKAFSDTITTDDMSFGSTSYISNSSNWSTTKGNITYGDTITMGSDSRCVVNRSFDNQKINYMKFKVKLDADDHSLTTDNGHAVTGLCTATYADDKGQTQTKQFHFYPKYVFEDDYRDDNVIIQLGNNQYLKNVKVELINKEEVPVKILETGLNVSRVVDEETFDDFSMEELENVEYMENLAEALGGYMDLVIPLVDELPDINDVPDGYICRLSTMR